MILLLMIVFFILYIKTGTSLVDQTRPIRIIQNQHGWCRTRVFKSTVALDSSHAEGIIDLPLRGRPVLFSLCPLNPPELLSVEDGKLPSFVFLPCLCRLHLFGRLLRLMHLFVP